ncbi:MAG: hypothetical protein M1823_000199 [Watsoniomyces obsoletus]|nr:MAG: hypothetical protein M1823_000199 [Watsoniomyces obsoletus]
MLSTFEQFAYHAEDVDRLSRMVDQGQLSNPHGGVPQTHRERVETLMYLQSALGRIWWTDAALAARVTDVVATTSRAIEWRVPVGESGLLEFFLEVISTEGVPNEILLPALRLVGNACADTDQNRQLAVESNGVEGIVPTLRDPQLAPVALAVIYNICVDYPPAQRRALDNGILSILIEVLEGQKLQYENSVVVSTCRLMQLLVDSLQATEQSPDNILKTLLQAASVPAVPEVEFDAFIAFVDLTVTLLANDHFQKMLIQERLLETFLTVLVDSYSRFPTSGSSGPICIDRSVDSSEYISPDDAKTLTRTRDRVIEVLSNVSALDQFVSVFSPSFDCPLFGALCFWLSVPQTQLQISACLMLGNLARTDEICRTMVTQKKLHEPLIRILRESQEAQLLHAAAGFLKNLTHLQANKVVIGEASLLEAASRLWSMDVLPQMQYAGAMLARQAVSGCYENIQRLLMPLSLDPDSPAHSRTYLSLLLHLCHQTDQAGIKTEVARTITAILRVLHSSTVRFEDLDEMRGRLYGCHETLARPLAYLARQTERSVVRSESWFAFALMARNREGAALVDDVVTEVEVFRVLVEIITDKKVTGGEVLPNESGEEETGTSMFAQSILSPTVHPNRQSSEGKRIDRENGLVLISQLLANRAHEMPEMRRQAFRDLLEGKEFMSQSFGELVASASSASTTPVGEMPPPLGDGGLLISSHDGQRRKSTEQQRRGNDAGNQDENENRTEPMLGGLLFADPRHAGGEWPSLSNRSPPAPEPWS